MWAVVYDLGKRWGKTMGANGLRDHRCAFFTSAEGIALLKGWARQGLTQEEIREKAGVCQQTWWRLKKLRPEIDAAIRQRPEVVDMMVEEALLNKALTGDVKACDYWLRYRKDMGRGAGAGAAEAARAMLDGAGEVRDIEGFIEGGASD